jgi:colanic acid/amylovoran biosynthesis glycosyltransferase
LSNLDVLGSARVRTWWKPKANNLLFVLLLALFVRSESFARSIYLLVLSLITIMGIGAFGHLINDWFDVKVDQRAGKINRFALFSLWQKQCAVLAAIAIGLLPWLALPRNRVSIFLLATELLLLVIYAAPPIRLKDRIYLSILADAAYAYALPAVLAAYTVLLAGSRSYDPLFVAALVPWQALLGIRHYLNHLALDRMHDLASGTRTLAVVKGNYYVHSILRNLLVPCEVVCLGLVLWRVGHYSLRLAGACFASFLAFSIFPIILAVSRPYSVLSYRFGTSSLDKFYQNVLPLVVIVFLMNRDIRFVLVPALALALVLLALLRRARATPIRLRYGSYWPFRLFLQPTPANIAPNIVVANINRAKYTETFINEALPRLKYNVYYLYGAELPIFDHTHRHMLSDELILHNAALLLETLFRLDHGHFAKNSIANYCQLNRIRLVLAEFGPVGVQLLPIARDLGIPLIVYFHGYDVFHKPTWNAHAIAYASLFDGAAKILTVSRLMGERLVESGASVRKIVHLPAFVNLNLFPYRDRSRLPPHFVAVGRFAETKSPHLTILAFHQVVQAIPQARLVMLGKDGGGDLFEACLILVKALRLEGHITFKGIVDHQAVALEMANARVFVQHSVTTPENHDKEGKPVAIMEAMASGLPVVATRHSGIAELITHNETGWLVEEYDIDAMATAMIRLAGDDSLVRLLGENGSRRIHDDPLIRDHIRILEEIIDELLVGDRL